MRGYIVLDVEQRVRRSGWFRSAIPAVMSLSYRCLLCHKGLRPIETKNTADGTEKTNRGVTMRKSKALPITSAERATLQPARVADAQLDHLEHMIRSLAVSADAQAFIGLDRAYWKRRLAALGDESDLVSTQRARVLRLLDLLEPEQAAGAPEKAAAWTIATPPATSGLHA